MGELKTTHLGAMPGLALSRIRSLEDYGEYFCDPDLYRSRVSRKKLLHPFFLEASRQPVRFLAGILILNAEWLES